jgi:hypothetical protein
MDWNNDFNWGNWNDPGASRSQNFSGPSGTNQTVPLASSDPSPYKSYQNGSHQDRTYHAPPAEDVSIKDISVGFQSVLPNPVAAAGYAIPRVKNEGLDWKAQKNAIRSLYMDEDKTLKATIDIMKNVYSFNAT